MALVDPGGVPEQQLSQNFCLVSLISLVIIVITIVIAKSFLPKDKRRGVGSNLVEKFLLQPHLVKSMYLTWLLLRTLHSTKVIHSQEFPRVVHLHVCYRLFCNMDHFKTGRQL